MADAASTTELPFHPNGGTATDDTPTNGTPAAVLPSTDAADDGTKQAVHAVLHSDASAS
jgi:hypothetical protein